MDFNKYLVSDVLLERVSFTGSRMILEQELKRPLGEVKIITDKIKDNLIFQVDKYISSSQINQIKIIYPSSKIDIIKEMMPKWIKKYIKIKYKTETLDIREIFPSLELHVPEKINSYYVCQNIK